MGATGTNHFFFFFFFFSLGGKSLFLGADRGERRLEMGGDACPTFLGS